MSATTPSIIPTQLGCDDCGSGGNNLSAGGSGSEGSSGGGSSGASGQQPGSISDMPYQDGDRATISDILTNAEGWLQPDYMEKSPGRFVSADGQRQFRMTDTDLADPNGHAAEPHVNFEDMEENPAKPGRMMPVNTIHVFFIPED